MGVVKTIVGVVKTVVGVFKTVVGVFKHWRLLPLMFIIASLSVYRLEDTPTTEQQQ